MGNVQHITRFFRRNWQKLVPMQTCPHENGDGEW